MKSLMLTAGLLLSGIKVCIAPEQSQTGAISVPDPAASALDEARKLLRKVYPLGALGEMVGLDPTFESMVGNPVTMTRDQVRSYLAAVNIQEADLGGNLDMAVSSTSEGSQAKYFVIHDTSFPTYGNKSLPSEINSASWQFNNFRQWRNNKVTHAFVNRMGESITVTDFSQGVMATKYEIRMLEEAKSKGLFIHIELIQPRHRDKRYWKGNDIASPTPGFTDGQYRRLALLYITASVRKGSWLIPGFHSCVDHGIRNKHDDPQGFELDKWMRALLTTVSDISKPTAAKTGSPK
ncbi:MAG: hypothetical protein RL329_2926 [Bacteroidota bacterium]